MRNTTALILACLALAGCSTFRHEPPPSNFIVFFPAKSTQLPADGQVIIKSAASAIRTTHPTSVVIEAGVKSGGNMDLSEPRFNAVRQALVAEGVPAELVARSAIPGPLLEGSKTGDQRVEIRLVAGTP